MSVVSRLRGAAVVGLVLAMGSACSSDSEPAADDTPSSTPTSEATSSTAAGSDPVRPPISDTTLPADWPGDDDAYLALLAEELAEAGLDPVGTDDESVALGRDLCTVLSGGGLIGDKVEFFSTEYGIVDGTQQIADAAGPTYCPAPYAAYVAVRAETSPGAGTATERADLFRFIVRRSTRDPTAVAEVTDVKIREQAADFCARLRKPDADLSQLTTLNPNVPAELLQGAYAVGLGLSYCPDVFAEVASKF